ncbi:MAG: hypothetical protein J5J06_16005 [Phycisphaerae bacterium]|nr:hypothetical protein [Phycisphaerae bacterium]
MKKSTERKMNLVVGTILLVQVGGVAFILIYNAVHKHRYHRDLLATKDLTLQFTGPGDIELQDPHAYARKEGLVVSGCLNATTPSRGLATNEVDVCVLSPKGTVLQETAIRELSRCKRGGVHFNTKFASIPPDGSVLDIKALAREMDDATPDSSADDPDG